MGGMAPAEGGKKGKKPLDAELNLVPFIDLLCSLISFLLMTAIWSEMAALELNQGPMGDEPPPQQEEQDKLSLKIFLTQKGFKLTGKETDIDIPCKAEPCIQPSMKDGEPHVSNYDMAQLTQKLTEKKTAWPNDEDVYIDIDDGVPYNEMIGTMDTCMTVGFKGISVGGSML